MSTIDAKLGQRVKISPVASDQAWLLVILAVISFVFAMVVVFIVSTFRDIEISAWEVVGTIVPWYVAVISGWITFRMAPMLVAHGKTRAFAFREWVAVGVIFTVIGAIAMSAGYLLEYWIYDIAGFSVGVGTENLFSSATQVHLVLLQYLLFFAVWFSLGGFAGVSLYKSDDVGWISIPVAIAIAALTGTLGYTGGGFMGIINRIVPSFEWNSIWLQVSILLVAVAFGVYITREMLKTISLRNP